MRTNAWRRRAAAGALAAATAALAAWTPTPASAATTCTLPPGNAMQQWDRIAQDTVLASGAFINEGLQYMAYADGAAYDAVMSITGRYAPLFADVPVIVPDASLDAAVAVAASDTLSAYFPDQGEAIACARDLALAPIPAGVAKDAGMAVGHASAATMIAARVGDGRRPLGTVEPSYPAAGPGVWQPTPPAFAAPQTPWVGRMHPFVLRSADAFRPGPPPSLRSRRWVRDFDEVKAWGGATSALRSPEQSDIARFWTSNPILQYHAGARDVASREGLDVTETARLVAELAVVQADTMIACFDAKYHYWFWRPVTAITASGATADGNPATVEEPGWTPLVATPNHPEYPGAHGCVSSAAAEVFSDYLRTPRIDLTVPGTTVATMPTRSFATADQLRDEIVQARLWGGLHFPTSTKVGEALGRRVARYDLGHAFEREW